MKKTLTLLLGLIFVTSNAFAGFNFGSDTYAKVDNKLIVNSLGDETQESEFKYNDTNLGYNDYIPENAFKNSLYKDGYTKVYDQKPNGVEVVATGYMGKLGDPRTYDNDYILKEEWEKYAAQSQNTRIINNKNNITNIDKSVSENTHKITKNTNKINNNIKSIDFNRDLINSNYDKISALDNRLSKLEETQYIIGAEIRIKDTRKWEVTAFADYSTNRSKFDRVGVRFQYKWGKSCAEKRIEELEQKINQLLN